MRAKHDIVFPFICYVWVNTADDWWLCKSSRGNECEGNCNCCTWLICPTAEIHIVQGYLVSKLRDHNLGNRLTLAVGGVPSVVFVCAFDAGSCCFPLCSMMKIDPRDCIVYLFCQLTNWNLNFATSPLHFSSALPFRHLSAFSLYQFCHFCPPSSPSIFLYFKSHWLIRPTCYHLQKSKEVVHHDVVSRPPTKLTCCGVSLELIYHTLRHVVSP
jgi:hypothetical protein